MSSGWRVRKGVREFGPFTAEQLQDYASKGKLDAEDLIWRGRPEDGVPAGQIAVLAEAFEFARRQVEKKRAREARGARRAQKARASFRTIDEENAPRRRLRLLLPILGIVPALLLVWAVFALLQRKEATGAPPLIRPATLPAPAAEAQKPRSAPAAPAPQDRVRPTFARYCFGCHGNKKKKGGVNLEAVLEPKAALRSPDTWIKVQEMLSGGTMPPKKRPQPKPGERKALLEWVASMLDAIEARTPPDPGRVVLRRLNKAEYSNTIRDLFGVDFRPAEGFPSDDVGYGFDNIGDVLSLPPLLMEKYLAAAGKILDDTIQAGGGAKAESRTFEGRLLRVEGNGRGGETPAVLLSSGEIHLTVPVPKDGSYLFRVRAGETRGGEEHAKMEIRVDRKRIRTFDVSAERHSPKTYETKVKLRAGQRRLSAAFINDFYDPKYRDKYKRDRNLYVHSFELAGPVDLPPAELPERHRRLLVAKPGDGVSKRQAARKILDRFLPLAFRRPLRDGEADRYVKLFELADGKSGSFEESMKTPIKAALVSPWFLFRVEEDRPGTSTHAIGDYELASRLSYFLWSSMPDAELFELAAAGRLGKPEVLASQARRMLKDPKARALAENFAVQWLQIGRLDTATPDPKVYQDFDNALRRAMKDEAILFFQEIVREDRSVVDLLKADFTYVNARLAVHYGIKGVEGRRMQRIDLPPESHRGGVLTMGAVLTVSSNPTRTSPVLRGKWVLETILGTPPPDPPADVPGLPAEPEDLRLSLRQRAEKHRTDPMCASCHVKMDPIGFGLENFDGIGRWREREGKLEINAAATLPDGRSFDGPKELRDVIVAHKDDFVRCLTEKMLTYALGRGVEFSDRRFLRAIGKEVTSTDYRVFALVRGIVTSFPFRHRRNRAG